MPRFHQRPYPSANTIELDGGVVIDPGAFALAVLARPSLIVNTHWHSDHAGANAALQGQGASVAAALAEAIPINAGDPDAGRGRYLRQRIEPYRVDTALVPGETVAAGATRWSIFPLPGHSPAQIGLWDPVARVLICADALSATDVGWLDLDADRDALDQADATIERIASLQPHLALPGHGPAITDVPAALATARKRLASWRADPERIAWHACKRIFTHALMLENGLPRETIPGYLLSSPWFPDHASRAFGIAPQALVPLLVAEMTRSGAARWKDDRLEPAGPYTSLSDAGQVVSARPPRPPA